MQADADRYGLESFEVFILCEGSEYEKSEYRKEVENQFIGKIPLEKRYNSNRQNGSFEKTQSPEFRQKLSNERKDMPNDMLGRGVSIPPFRSRKGNQSPGGMFLSMAEASKNTGMSRRDIRQRLDDPTLPDWRELTEEEKSLLKQKQH